MHDSRGKRVGLRSPVAVLVGIGLGLLVTAVVLRLLPKVAVPAPVAAPEALGGTLLAEDEGPIAELLFQYVPELEPLTADAYADFLPALDPTTRLVAVVPAGASQALLAFLAKIDPGGAVARRTRIVEVKAPITVWSKDRALVMGPDGPARGRTTLLIPVPPDPHWHERTNDWATLAQLAGKEPDHYFVRELPLAFDAGDFTVTKDRVLVDTNLFAKNRGRGLASPEALSAILRGLFGREVLLLGTTDGDVPRHHMSMYMASLGDHVMLVGDPRLALPIVGPSWTPGEASPDTGDPLKADFGDVMVARHDRVARDLAAAGYRVERIPTVAFDDKTYMAYTNGVYETRGGRRIAYVPQYGVPALDDAARGVYVRLGWEVHPIRVRSAYPYHGTIGCLANVLARGA